MALIAAHVSSPTGLIRSGGSRKPWSPVSGSSNVYEYLMRAVSNAQSDAVPEAASKSKRAKYVH